MSNYIPKRHQISLLWRLWNFSHQFRNDLTFHSDTNRWRGSLFFGNLKFLGLAVHHLPANTLIDIFRHRRIDNKWSQSCRNGWYQARRTDYFMPPLPLATVHAYSRNKRIWSTFDFIATFSLQLIFANVSLLYNCPYQNLYTAKIRRIFLYCYKCHKPSNNSSTPNSRQVRDNDAALLLFGLEKQWPSSQMVSQVMFNNILILTTCS